MPEKAIINSLPYIDIDPPIPAQKTIIWMHGLGADGNDFVPIVSELNFPPELGVRFVFPHAPIIPVTINNGYKMRAWFDIFELSITAKMDEERIAQSVSAITELIAEEEGRGVSSEKIILAGFSQGSVIALAAGLGYPKPLAGVLALSGYLPLAQQFFQTAAAANRRLPIFIGHGTEDTVVPYALGQITYANLKQAGYPVDWHSYPIAHTLNKEEVADISQWIQARWR